MTKTKTNKKRENIVNIVSLRTKTPSFAPRRIRRIVLLCQKMNIRILLLVLLLGNSTFGSGSDQEQNQEDENNVQDNDDFENLNNNPLVSEDDDENGSGQFIYYMIISYKLYIYKFNIFFRIGTTIA